MQQTIEHIRRYLGRTPRFLASLLAVVALVAVLSPTVLAVNVVTVTDADTGEDRVVMTSSLPTHELLGHAGYDVDEDEPIAGLLGELAEDMVEAHTFSVTLLADGETHTVEFLDGTVADLLAACEIELGDEDYTDYALDSGLEAGMEVELRRVRYETETAEAAEVDERLVDNYIASLGEDRTFKKSDLGLYDVTWQHRYDGEEITDTEVLDLLPLFGVRGDGTTAFLDGVAVSRIEEFEGVTLGADGLPTEYNYVMENAITTAYSSSSGKGASGLGLYYGTVAVDPAKIPYGTRLFITSADGVFVYGFAIATDTGTAMREGYVDIDLFFETNAECLAFGKRGLVVYVLD